MKKESGSRTLLMSVVMSSPGPIVVGIGLFMGKSSTQIADFVRRSAELLAIIVSFVVYTLNNKDTEENNQRKARLERATNLFVGATMCLSGAVMLCLALFSKQTEKGNVIPGLVIAILGVVANTLFWFKYAKLSRETNNVILAVQSRLYRAKSFVDTCVTIALGAVALFPLSDAAYYLDMVGSVIVAVYLIWCGGRTVWENRKRRGGELWGEKKM